MFLCDVNDFHVVIVKIFCDISYSLAFERHVYNHCTSVQTSGSSTSGRVSANKKRPQPTGGAQFVGLELYKKLKDFLQTYLLGLLNVSLNCKLDNIATFYIQIMNSQLGELN